MGKPSVLISIQTAARTEAKAFGRRFMQMLIDENRSLVPELVSTSERFKDPFVNLDHFIDHWWAIPIKSYMDDRIVGERFGGPMWKRKSTLASRGMISHGVLDVKNERTPSRLWFESRYDAKVDFSRMFNGWVDLARPSIGMLHVFTEAEKVMLQNEAGSWFQSGSFGGPAKPGLPNMGWAMAYGGDYAAEVDVARIKDAGFPVREISNAIIVQITNSLSDVVDDFAFFLDRRAELKRHFRSELFWPE